MNANPPINVAMAAARMKKTKQKIMQQMIRKQSQAAPGVGQRGAAAGAGGRSIFGGNNAKLPIPHLTRQSRLAPALIAALGIGASGIPDQAVGGIANGIQDNVASQAQGIPDWAPPPGPGGAQTPTPGDPATDPTAANSPLLGTTPGNNAQANATDFTMGGNAAPGTVGDWAYDGGSGLVHLGNGVYYDTTNGIFRSGNVTSL